jgi:TonB family protein
MPGFENNEAVSKNRKGSWLTVSVIAALAFLFAFGEVSATNINISCSIDSISPKAKSGIFCEYPEVCPEFPGGTNKMINYLRSQIRYTDEMRDKCVQGRVIVQFVVEADGLITHVKVMRGIEPTYDKEALRVVKSMPKWKPGTMYGKKVRFKYTVPVVFGMQQSNNKK